MQPEMDRHLIFWWGLPPTRWQSTLMEGTYWCRVPYYFQKDWWHSMQGTLDKGPIRHLGKYILKHDKGLNLTIMASQTHQLHKWFENKDIDKILSNDLWTNPAITDKQKTCFIEFRTGQYMGHAQKQLFFGREAYMSKACPICNSYRRMHGYMHYSNANNNTSMH